MAAKKHTKIYKCSFCLCDSSDVEVMFEGIKGNICASCIRTAHFTLLEWRDKKYGKENKEGSA